MLNTHHLTTFKILAETSSFTKTAQQLGLTQPAVTQHIQKLESELGEALLVRHGRTTEITEAGELLLRHIKSLETCYKKFQNKWHSVLKTSLEIEQAINFTK
ncbi:LysR family transcriptional regulator [Marinomonas sp. C2222]|uniref:LysR family transcriptional regulator n=1 Tax=Marinomonas sargassi TaxID=2984494 RepID=A0ABT2YTS5_9GAMM|nr:LysR family transcriptional regulator [Marinomonas sargassi]MCV2403281.1 LysR family transcriptional regulator [Marinomonas sargassi]